ncbi:MAG TPA: hypothetical protein VFZ62_02135 [Candidatus Saccharimonadales bacterium]
MVIEVISNSEKSKDSLSALQTIVKTVQDYGSAVAEALATASGITDWPTVQKETMESLTKADLVIVEATEFGFMEGYYTAQALHYKKPLLMLTRQSIADSPASGIKDRFLTLRHYDNAAEIKEIVDTFLRENSISAKDLRFNFFLDRKLYSYLREVSYESGKNKSEIIRELLEKEIEKREN